MPRTILITGAGGTVGLAFTEYLLEKGNNVIGIDNNEWAIAEYRKKFPQATAILGDFVNYKFYKEPVDVVIHCAAYKHVEIGEGNVESLIDENINKTARLFERAYRYGADVIFMSTDKAVEPISAYGFTKALGEKLCKRYNGTVCRCGNILSSSGSVIPLWEKAIAEGRKIPITDPRMMRYVIEADDAVKQIWTSFLKGNKLIIPKCKKIKLMEMLDKVLASCDLTIEDVETEQIGIRPGEKLEEKLRWDSEN